MRKYGLRKIVVASSLFAMFAASMWMTASQVAAADSAGEPQFRIEITGSDHAGFDIDYSYPDSAPQNCTVKVHVVFSDRSEKSPKSVDFEFTHKIHSTGNGWAFFDGKSALDKIELKDVRITSKSCSNA